MSQPLAYYGCKRLVVSELLKLIPPHKQYCELFLGGGSLFWNKPPSQHEVLNDIDGDVTNFYYQVKTNFAALQKLIQGTLHSEVNWRRSKEILDDKNCSDMLLRAWAFWCQCNLSYGGIVKGGFGHDRGGQKARSTANKRDMFTIKYAERLRNVEIFQRDAIELLELKQSDDTFFYLDPPYVSSCQGHYKGYTLDDFKNLLEKLKNIKGKFLLSSYPEDILMKYRQECGWHSHDITKQISVNRKFKVRKMKKTECLTFNYEPPIRNIF